MGTKGGFEMYGGWPTNEVRILRQEIDALQRRGLELDPTAYEAQRRDLEALYERALRRQWAQMDRSQGEV